MGDGLALLRVVDDVQQLGEGWPGEAVRSEPVLPCAVVDGVPGTNDCARDFFQRSVR